jgi:putative transcriptional regulator
MADVKELLAEKIAGEITLSENPGETIKKWRRNFEISQIEIAEHLSVAPSVISDYESGRRKSPGTILVSRIVRALLDIDVRRGGKKIQAYESILYEAGIGDVIYDIYEYSSPINLGEFKELIGGILLTQSDLTIPVNGYTIIDSIKAILKLPSSEFYRLYGWSTQRALIFTAVTTGKSPLVAVRVTNLKPGAVVLHDLPPEKVDPIAVKIAEMENVPLLTTEYPVDELMRVLRK